MHLHGLGSLATHGPHIGTCCIICGHDMERYFWVKKERLQGIFAERSEWSACARERGYIVGNTSDLSRMYFSKPSMWHGFYRAILQQGNEFFLTGVAVYGPWSHDLIRVPKNSNKFFIGNPWDASKMFVESYPTYFLIDPQVTIPYAYSMHERCWLLATRILDGDLIQAHLGFFVNALFGVPGPLTRMIRFIRSWLRKDREIPARNSWRLHGTPTLKPLLTRVQCVKHSNCFFPDPWKVVDIQKFIYLERQLQEKIDFTPCSGQKQATNPSTNVFIPPELVLIIMDFLSGCWELRALMWAFPQWAYTIPQSYWRTRFIKDLMLEDEEVPGAEELHWRRAYYKIDGLVMNSAGLLDRRRTVKILKYTERTFTASISSASSTISDVVAGQEKGEAAD